MFKLNNLGLGALAICATVMFFSSCDLVESPDDTENIELGKITYPALDLVDGDFLIVPVGSDYSEPGFSATLGTADISGDVQVEGSVDANTIGFYSVTYSVEITDELGNPRSVVRKREVLVRGEDYLTRDLSGSYQGSGFGSDVATVTQVSPGVYMIDKLLASRNNIGVTFYDDGGDGLAIPSQSTRFGEVNTTNPGTSANITDDGFMWVAFIGCCGNFGPITFEKL